MPPPITTGPLTIHTGPDHLITRKRYERLPIAKDILVERWVIDGTTQ